MQKGLWTRQYLSNTELSPSKQEKKGNHDLKWSSPFDCQPKSCVSVTCSPHTKQKQKKKTHANIFWLKISVILGHRKPQYEKEK